MVCRCFSEISVSPDQIGFVYSRNTADVAVEDFITRLKEIAASVPQNGQHIVSVILDGENAWEYFPGRRQGVSLQNSMNGFYPRKTSCR